MASIGIIGAGQIGGAIAKQLYAGDDAGAKAEIAALIERLGFFGVDMGDIETGSRTFQSPGGPLIAHDFVKVG